MRKILIYLLLFGKILLVINWLRLAIYILIILVLWDTHKLIKDNRDNISSISTQGAEVTTKANNFLTPEYLDYLREATKAQLESTEQATQGASGITLATIDTLERHVQPAIDTFSKESAKTLQTIRSVAEESQGDIKAELQELRALTVELKRQIAQNGDATHQLLQQGSIMIAKSQEDLLSTLASLRATSKQIEVLTNDPAITSLLHNIDDSAFHVSVISGDLAALAHHTIDPIVNPAPPKNSFDKYFVRPVIKIAKIVSGAGNVFYLIQRFQ